MINSINRYGEISTNKNETLITIPFYRLGTDNLEELEDNYRKEVKQLEYSPCFFYAESFTSIRDRLQMTFDLTGAYDFHNIRKINFDNLLPYIDSMIDIANENVNVLWEKENFALDTQEERVKAFLFDYEGFSIYKHDKPVDGLKELILLALTNKNSIIGKPRRVDFIQQDDKVIQFAEDVLKCERVEDIETLVDGYKKDIEYRKAQEEQEKEEKLANSKLEQLKHKIALSGGKKETNIDDHLKRELQQQEQQTAATSTKTKTSFKDKMTSGKGMIITIAVIAVIGIFSTFATRSTSGKDNELEKSQDQVKEQQQILKVYRDYITANDDEDREIAIQKMESIGYKNLDNKEDKKILIRWYIDQDKIAKALSVDKSSSYLVGDELVATDDGLEKLKDAASNIGDNKVVNFDIASMEDEYQTMIDNKEIKLNKRRASDLVEAYLKTNQDNELNQYIDRLKDYDNQSYENVRSEMDKKSVYYEDQEELEQEKEELEDKIASKEKDKDDAKKKEKKRIKKEISDLKSDLSSKEDQIERKEEKIGE